MNFKSLLVVGLSVATLGLSLPAHADDTATVIDSNQGAVTTGDANYTRQSNDTTVNNRAKGRPGDNNTGTSVRSNQNADTLGKGNVTSQSNSAAIYDMLHSPSRRH